MAKKLGTQDKVRVKRSKQHLAWLAQNFKGADLGDRADRIGPEMVKVIEEIAELEGWDD